jgi:hypothetical protein
MASNTTSPFPFGGYLNFKEYKNALIGIKRRDNTQYRTQKKKPYYLGDDKVSFF